MNTDQIPSLQTSTEKLLMDGGSVSLKSSSNKARIFDIQTNENEDEDED